MLFVRCIFFFFVLLVTSSGILVTFYDLLETFIFEAWLRVAVLLCSDAIYNLEGTLEMENSEKNFPALTS